MFQRLHVCKICGKKFRTPKGVDGHQRVHSGKKSTRVGSPIDDNAFQRIWGLKESRVSAFCDKEISTVTESLDLLRTGSSLSLKESSFMTPIEPDVKEAAMTLVLLSERDLDFATIRNLPPMELELKPMQEKITHCAESKQDFSELLSHSGFDKSSTCSEIRFGDDVAQALPSSPYKCKICGKCFGCAQALGGHKTLHRSIMLFGDAVAQPLPPPYKCKICGEYFWCSQALGGHQTLHRSIRMAHKRKTLEDGNSLSDSKAKKVVSRPSSLEVSQEHCCCCCCRSCSQWQQQPAPAPAMQPAEMSQSAVDAYYASYYAYYAPFPDPSLNPYPNSTSGLQTHDSSAIAIPPAPGVADAYSSAGLLPVDSAATVSTAPATATASYVTVDTTPFYALDTNAHNLAWREAVRTYGTDPHAFTGAGAAVQTNGTGQLHSTYPSISWTGHIVQAQLPECVSLKKQSKKGKVVQSSYCQVCKVDCNGPSVFDQHILGKKHLKNLEKLQKCLPSFNTDSLAGPAVAVPLIGPQENPCKSKAKKNKKKGAESTEDLEAKRRKVLECGAANESIRLCRICNIVCNSDKVYNDHLASQKHAAKAAKAPVNA